MSDLDGTRLASGAALTIASARSFPAIKALLSGVNLALPLIEPSGAHLSAPTTGTHLISYTITDTDTVQAQATTITAPNTEDGVIHHLLTHYP